MVTVTIASIVPNSPRLNEDFYIVFGFAGSTFTGAFASIGSVVAPIKASGASFAAIYPAGSVATGTYSIYAFYATASDGSFANNKTIQIRNSDIAEPQKTIYTLIKDNLGSSYASTLVTTGWYSLDATPPQVTVTTLSRETRGKNLYDTWRDNEDRVYVDTWISARAFGVGMKAARALLDGEIKRIVNANRKAYSTKWRHMEILRSEPLDEISDNRKFFRTRHTVRIRWDETLS